MSDQEQPRDNPAETWCTLAVPCTLGVPTMIMVILAAPATEDITFIPTSSIPDDVFTVSEPD